MKPDFFLFVLTCFHCQRLPVLGQNWPNPGSLFFFAPLDEENGLNNVIKKDDPYRPNSGVLDTSKPGPFGVANSSHTVSCNSCSMVNYVDFPNYSSFTLSMYFFVSRKQSKGGIGFFYGNTERFCINYNETTIEVHRFGKKGQFPIASFEVRNFFTNGWTFFCLTYDASKETATLFNEKAIPVHYEYNFPIPDATNQRSILGSGKDRETLFTAMVPGDAMACVMIYSEVLQPDEIAQLPNVCGKNNDQPTPLPEPDHLIGLWPLSAKYKLTTVDNSNKFQPVSFNQCHFLHSCFLY